MMLDKSGKLLQGEKGGRRGRGKETTGRNKEWKRERGR